MTGIMDQPCNHSVEMEEDDEFKRQLELFVKSSTEKGIELVKIGEIIAGLTGRRSFLDIGAGGGELTIPVSLSFEKTTVVETNEQQTRYLQRRCPHFRIIRDSWEDVDLGSEQFDLILCSHVLYYITEDRWVTIIEKMYAHLAKGGCMAIVIQSPIGEVADFFRRFTTYDINILPLWGEMIRRYGDQAVSVKYFTNDIFTEKLEETASIGLFLLIDRNFRKRKDEIIKYFEEHHRSQAGYHIQQDEIILIVKK